MKIHAEIAPRIIELFELSHQLKILADTNPEVSSLSKSLYNDINALFLAQNFQMMVEKIIPLLEQISVFTSSSSVNEFIKNELEKIKLKLKELQNLIENE